MDRKEKQGGACRWGLREGQGFTVVILEKRCREEDGGGGRGAFMRGMREEKEVQYCMREKSEKGKRCVNEEDRKKSKVVQVGGDLEKGQGLQL